MRAGSGLLGVVGVISVVFASGPVAAQTSRSPLALTNGNPAILDTTSFEVDTPPARFDSAYPFTGHFTFTASPSQRLSLSLRNIDSGLNLSTIAPREFANFGVEVFDQGGREVCWGQRTIRTGESSARALGECVLPAGGTYRLRLATSTRRFSLTLNLLSAAPSQANAESRLRELIDDWGDGRVSRHMTPELVANVAGNFNRESRMARDAGAVQTVQFLGREEGGYKFRVRHASRVVDWRIHLDASSRITALWYWRQPATSPAPTRWFIPGP